MITMSSIEETGVQDDETPDDALPADDAEVALPIEDAIDLHAFAPRDVRDVVDAYLEAAQEAGFGEVRIIHGRGIGVQREAVRSLLARHPRVRSFSDAPPERGGWGATVVLLEAPDEPAG
jgi:DNA-nicking Smr family endonuclease